jgi:N-acetyl-anhydromuramyl-L-alanine amidase AmpD
MYDVSPESICAANGIQRSDPLKIGQKLIVPNVKMLRHVINLYPNPQWRYIILHHTATEMGNARTINVSHGARGFWNGLGYHFLIDNGTLGKGDGQIEMSPRWIRQQNGAHCKAGGMNDKAIGISLVGNFSLEQPTPNQMQSLTYLVKILCSYYRIPPENIMGHREVDGAHTECPGKYFPIEQIIRSVRR